MASKANPAETFKQEAGDLLVQLESVLLDMEATPENRELVDQAFRCLHTLKGSGAMFGWEALAAFTHHLETTFQLVRDGKLPVNGDLVSLTLAALDHIRGLLNRPDDVDRVRGDALLVGFDDFAAGNSAQAGAAQAGADRRRVETRRPVDTHPGPEEADDVDRVFRIRWWPGQDHFVIGGNPLLLLDELRSLGQCMVVPLSERVPGLEELEPTACHLGWDVVLTTRESREKIDEVFIFVADQSDLVIEEIAVESDAVDPPRLGEILVKRGDVAPEALEQQLGRQERLGQLLVKSGVVSEDRLASALGQQVHVRAAAQAREVAAAGSTIRVPAERLDALMDQVGELVIAQARLRQATDGADPLLKSIAEDIERLSSELRDTTMSVRMLPISTLFGRFRRVVHDLSRELGKSVAMTTEGDETELDKTMIESLNDPLMHLIRNSIDHGIELAEQRRKQGKAAEGRLHLSAIHSGASVLITIDDDGRGLDRASIRAKAEERGLLQPGQEVSEADLFACIFQPGFSTAPKITSVSGRGVGMDVVKKTIDGLHGTIEVSSRPGAGSTVTLKLPLTLAIIDGLLVRLGDERYVLPLSSVEECVELTRGDDHRSEGRNFLNIRGEIVAFIRLRQLFDVSGETPLLQKVVIVGAGGARVGLVVDQVIGQHQTVIKSLSRLHRDIEGFSGATILGDGSVSLILDIPHLIKFAREQEYARRTL